ncbi:phosphotransferase family protein [Rhodotorula paludigena]|uniref:phosphotransferase family protein n=1 Tax=Rhodotorula paludigena TaxID=86838 RepID=UPI00317D29C0
MPPPQPRLALHDASSVPLPLLCSRDRARACTIDSFAAPLDALNLPAPAPTPACAPPSPLCTPDFLASFPEPERIILHQLGTVLHAGYGTTVRRIRLASGCDIVVKHGPEIRPEEVDAMRFVREHSAVPVPEVYDVRIWDEDVVFIYMEYISGDTFAAVYPTLALDAQRALRTQLASLVHELHALRAPPGALVGCFDPDDAVGDNLDVRLAALVGATRRAKPASTRMTSTRELVAWIRAEYLARARERPALRGAPTAGQPERWWDALYAPRLDPDAPLVFSHGDLHPFNLVVRDGEIVAMLDFGRAGWWPEWLDAHIAASGSPYMQPVTRSNAPSSNV